jgi:Lar family restriction alleviation protein
MSALKPCPFCGGEAGVVVHRPFPDAYVQCGECDAEGPVSASEAAAVDAWNRRAVDPALAAAEARAEKAEAALREVAARAREAAQTLRAVTPDANAGPINVDEYARRAARHIERLAEALREAKASTLREVAEDFERRATTSDICADKAIDPRNFSGTSLARHEMHNADAARFRDEAKRLRDAAALAPTTTEGGAE